MSKRKQASYAGIPAKERARVKRLLNLYAGGLDVLGGVPGAPSTPQEVWKSLTDHWERRREEEKKKSLEAEEQRIASVRYDSLQDIKRALDAFSCAVGIAHAIERDNQKHFDYQDLGRFARLCLKEGGQKLEQALCNLGIIPESDCPLFVDDELKSHWLKAPAEEDEQEVA